MSRTIGRHRPKRSPRGDFETVCDYCGIPYLRSELKRDRAGLLACWDDRRGRDAVTLNQENAAHASRPRESRMHQDGGNYDNSGPTVTVGQHETSEVDI